MFDFLINLETTQFNSLKTSYDSSCYLFNKCDDLVMSMVEASLFPKFNMIQLIKNSWKTD
jgi:hypothetical protein